jgi:hypothetical protein
MVFFSSLLEAERRHVMEWLQSIPWYVCVPVAVVAYAIGHAIGGMLGQQKHGEGCWITHRGTREWEERERWSS